MTMKNLTTSYDLFVKVLKLEKDECVLALYENNVALEEINQQVLLVSEKINSCQKVIRESMSRQGASLDVDSYDLSRISLADLNRSLGRLTLEQSKAQSQYNAALAKVQQKTRIHDKLIEKQQSQIEQKTQEIEKKLDAELEDLSMQKKWVYQND